MKPRSKLATHALKSDLMKKKSQQFFWICSSSVSSVVKYPRRFERWKKCRYCVVVYVNLFSVLKFAVRPFIAGVLPGVCMSLLGMLIHVEA